MRTLRDIALAVDKLKEQQADAHTRFLMKDGSIVTLTRKDARQESFIAWVENNSSPEHRDSTGAKLHTLIMMVNGTTEAPFESWEAFKRRGHDLLRLAEDAPTVGN